MGYYIIEINDKYKQVVLLSAEGELYCKDVAGLMRYTEPDLDAVRKEAYQEGFNKGLSNTIMPSEAAAYEKGYLDAEKSAYKRGYETAKHECEDCRELRGGAEQELASKTYQRGLSDAWDAARKIWENDINTLHKIFGWVPMRMDVFLKFTASEVIEKLKAYEQEKEEQIQVGDEVEWNGDRYVITYIDVDETYVDVIDCSCGSVCDRLAIKGITKTGRHFPEIVEVLEKMREGQEQ